MYLLSLCHEKLIAQTVFFVNIGSKRRLDFSIQLSNFIFSSLRRKYIFFLNCEKKSYKQISNVNKTLISHIRLVVKTYWILWFLLLLYLSKITNTLHKTLICWSLQLKKMCPNWMSWQRFVNTNGNNLCLHYLSHCNIEKIIHRLFAQEKYHRSNRLYIYAINKWKIMIYMEIKSDEMLSAVYNSNEKISKR